MKGERATERERERKGRRERVRGRKREVRKVSFLALSIPLFLLPSPDAPWCEIRPTHASSKLVTTQFSSKKKEKWEKGLPVKSRNEPQNVV